MTRTHTAPAEMPVRAGRTPAATLAPATLSNAALLTLLSGSFLAMLDAAIVNVALPSMARTLHSGDGALELVVAGYATAYALLLVIGARLGDTLGRKRLFIAGMAGFISTSTLAGLAPTMTTLIIARILQGAAAAVMVPQVLATIHATTAGRARARAMAMFGAGAGMAVAAGQVVGGVLISADIAGSGWRPIFLVNVPVGLLAVFAAWKLLPETRADRAPTLDLLGTVTLALTIAALLIPLTEGRAQGWPWWCFVLLAAVPVLAISFARVEQLRARSGRLPLVPPALLAVPGIKLSLLMVVLVAGTWASFSYLFALMVQSGLGFGPLEAGLAMLPTALIFWVASLASKNVVARIGAPATMALAAVVQGGGLLWLGLVVADRWPHVSILEMTPALLVFGVGQAMMLVPALSTVLARVPGAMSGVGAGVMSTTQQSAMALGVAVIGTLYSTLSGAGTAHIGTAFRACLLVLLVGSIAFGVGGVLLHRLDRRVALATAATAARVANTQRVAS